MIVTVTANVRFLTKSSTHILHIIYTLMFSQTFFRANLNKKSTHEFQIIDLLGMSYRLEFRLNITEFVLQPLRACKSSIMLLHEIYVNSMIEFIV